MAWTTPATYSDNAILDAADMNLIRDNLNALKDPPSDVLTTASFTAPTTNSTTFVDVSTTYFQVAITTTVTGDIMVGGTFTCTPSDSATVRTVTFDLMRNGTSVSSATGISFISGNSSQSFAVPLLWVLTDIAAGTHTIKLRWKINNGASTATINSGTVGAQFWAREMS